MPSMMMHGSAVYLFLSKSNWKETWLSLSEDGVLTWKRKDAYQVKGTVELEQVLDQVHVSLPAEKHRTNGFQPYLLAVPLKVKGKLSTKHLALKNGPDLELWLNAMANCDGRLRLLAAIRRKHVERLASIKDLPEELVLRKVDYKELVTFYKSIWDEYVRHRRNPPPVEHTEAMVSVSSGVHLIEINGNSSEVSFESQNSFPESDSVEDEDVEEDEVEDNDEDIRF